MTSALSWASCRFLVTATTFLSRPVLGHDCWTSPGIVLEATPEFGLHQILQVSPPRDLRLRDLEAKLPAIHPHILSQTRCGCPWVRPRPPCAARGRRAHHRPAVPYRRPDDAPSRRPQRRRARRPPGLRAADGGRARPVRRGRRPRPAPRAAPPTCRGCLRERHRRTGQDGQAPLGRHLRQVSLALRRDQCVDLCDLRQNVEELFGDGFAAGGTRPGAGVGVVGHAEHGPHRRGKDRAAAWPELVARLDVGPARSRFGQPDRDVDRGRAQATRVDFVQQGLEVGHHFHVVATGPFEGNGDHHPAEPASIDAGDELRVRRG